MEKEQMSVSEAKICANCEEKYDSREDNIGLKSGTCYKCNVKNLKNIRRPVFLDNCEVCEKQYDIRERIREGKNVCKECIVGQLKLVECKATIHFKCENDECKKCYYASFACHEKSKYWNNCLNEGLFPRNVALNSHKKCWFKCEKCGHDIKIMLKSINLRGHWCGFCDNKKQCDNLDCVYCFHRSFASHEKSKYWNLEKNNGLSTRECLLSSKKYRDL
jgi:hypothetical protein